MFVTRSPPLFYRLPHLLFVRHDLQTCCQYPLASFCFLFFVFGGLLGAFYWVIGCHLLTMRANACVFLLLFVCIFPSCALFSVNLCMCCYEELTFFFFQGTHNVGNVFESCGCWGCCFQTKTNRCYLTIFASHSLFVAHLGKHLFTNTRLSAAATANCTSMLHSPL